MTIQSIKNIKDDDIINNIILIIKNFIQIPEFRSFLKLNKNENFFIEINNVSDGCTKMAAGEILKMLNLEDNCQISEIYHSFVDLLIENDLKISSNNTSFLSKMFQWDIELSCECGDSINYKTSKLQKKSRFEASCLVGPFLRRQHCNKCDKKLKILVKNVPIFLCLENLENKSLLKQVIYRNDRSYYFSKNNKNPSEKNCFYTQKSYSLELDEINYIKRDDVVDILQPPEFVFEIFFKKIKTPECPDIRKDDFHLLLQCPGFVNFFRSIDKSYQRSSELICAISKCCSAADHIRCDSLNELRNLPIFEILESLNTYEIIHYSKHEKFHYKSILSCLKMLFFVTVKECQLCMFCGTNNISYTESWTISLETLLIINHLKSKQGPPCETCNKSTIIKHSFYKKPYYITVQKNSGIYRSAQVFPPFIHMHESTTKNILNLSYVLLCTNLKSAIYKQREWEPIAWQKDIYNIWQKDTNNDEDWLRRYNSSIEEIKEGIDLIKSISSLEISPITEEDNKMASSIDLKEITKETYNRIVKLEIIDTWANSNKCGNHRHFGLYNPSNYCFMNAVVQCLNHCPGLFELANSPKISEKFEILKKHFKRMNEHASYGIKSPLHEVFSDMNPYMRKGDQHDSAEYFNNFLSYWENIEVLHHRDDDNISEEEKKTSSIGTMFGGVSLITVMCLTCNLTKTSKNHFFSLPVNVKNCSSVNDALKKYPESEKMNGLFCRPCRDKKEAMRKSTLHNLPCYFTVQIGRFG
eukprot:GHVL01033803.1.p1 GENE.GHVL01033803.1~~GHVL01033803.1.p1  ORF type:complete len:781 (-),score=113.74 GHVL01033803.1:785-3049(-)